jgi:hypothetical protein
MDNISEENIDLDKDGKVSSKEYTIYEQRAKNRRSMAWVSLFAMIATVLLLMFFIPESRIEKLGSVLELYWLALGSVVTAYVGITAWNKRG